MSTSPLPSSGLPSGSTMRPSSPLPTGISSSLPERLTVSPSSILSHGPNSTTPTLSDSRLSARPVTSCGSSSSSDDMTLSSPWTREMPSATDSTVPTSEGSAPPSSSPWMRSLRMLVISSGLICTFRGSYRFLAHPAKPGASGLRRLGDLLSKLFESVADGGVEDHVAPPHHQPAEYVGVDVRGQVHPAPGLLLDAPADLLDQARVELRGAGHRDRQQLVLLCPGPVKDPPDPEQDRHAVPLGEQLEEVEEALVGVAHDPPDAHLLLLAREVGGEQEHLQVAIGVERVGALPPLVVQAVEDVVVLGRLEQRARVDLGDLLHGLVLALLRQR